MPKIGAAHAANGEYIFVSIDGNDLVYRGPSGLVKGSDVPEAEIESEQEPDSEESEDETEEE